MGAVRAHNSHISLEDGGNHSKVMGKMIPVLRGVDPGDGESYGNIWVSVGILRSNPGTQNL